MRRLLVWSALALVIGLAIAAGGYWAYWNFYARFQPTTITRNQAEIQRLLDEASWVSGGGGGDPLYIVTYRDSQAGQRYEREEGPKLAVAGVEPRIIVFARPDREGLRQSTAVERATVAEVWLSRDWELYQRWTATPSRNWTAAGIPAADGNMARSAVVDASRQFVARLNTLLRGAGAPSGYPLVLWRDREGFLKACACADARSWAFIRDDLGAPDSAGTPGLEPGPPAPTAPPDTQPYPDLGPIAPAPTTIPPAAQPGPMQPGTTPLPGPSPVDRPPAQTAPRGAAPPARPAPQAEKQDDATFF